MVERTVSHGSLCVPGMFVKTLRKKFQDFLAYASTTAEETISSIRTVRSFTGEDKTLTTYSNDIDKSYDIGKKLSLAAGQWFQQKSLKRSRYFLELFRFSYNYMIAFTAVEII